jgi:tRNA-dihydrouridine synthase B
MRKHAAWYTRGLKGSAELRERFNRAASKDEFVQILHEAWDI